VKELLRNLAFLTEYDGSAFNGWQSQASGRTVQQTLQRALFELTGEIGLQLTGSSRTDSGVHARGHVSHFSTLSRIPAAKMALAINSHLPQDVTVLAACEVMRWVKSIPTASGIRPAGRPSTANKFVMCRYRLIWVCCGRPCPA
jgi:tRNA pseudouridine(38-40) synthase